MDLQSWAYVAAVFLVFNPRSRQWLLEAMGEMLALVLFVPRLMFGRRRNLEPKPPEPAPVGSSPRKEFEAEHAIAREEIATKGQASAAMWALALFLSCAVLYFVLNR